MRFTRFSKVPDIVNNPLCRQVLTEQFPEVGRQIDRLTNLYQYEDRLFCYAGYLGVQEKDVDAMLDAFNRAVYTPNDTERSLDMLERRRFCAQSSPAQQPARAIDLQPGGLPDGETALSVSLDGVWKMAADTDGGNVFGGLASGGGWDADVPGSVHAALERQALLPDASVGLNQRLARAQSFRAWWFLREFPKPAWEGTTLLCFDGVCDRADFYLNGHLLGHHQGMFGGPVYDITPYLQAENRLLVRLDAVPFVKSSPHSQHPDTPNGSWRETVVVNNAYGWHYANVQPLGIWRSVRLAQSGSVLMDTPFLFTKAIDTDANGFIGHMVLALDFYHDRATEGTLRFTITPENFDGEAWHYKETLPLDGTCGSLVKNGRVRRHTKIALAFAINRAHLWWPVDIGRPDCYRCIITFVGADGCVHRHSFLFGVRTVVMASPDNIRREDEYDWVFVINGRQQFVKGTGWCTMDTEMRFAREKYDRFLTMARRQHIQMLRAWGGGMPETDDFYELCDLYGIMVLQEWPTMADSHQTQPYDVLKETVVLNTLRLRNHPSLVMWGAGNESPNAYGDVIDMMGRLSLALDGTRPFHAGEPWGGSLHSYLVWWHWRHFDYNLTLEARFLGEFGICCLPGVSSVERYLPNTDFDAPPPLEDEAFQYHNPVFGSVEDVQRLIQYAGYFLPPQHTFRQFITASQLSQIIGVRHTLERARTRWPVCTGALYYKLNDNFPAASWSTVDWYGTAKLGYYAIQDALAPLCAVALFSSVRLYGTACELPVFILDDADSLQNQAWKVHIRAFNAALDEIAHAEYEGFGSVAAPHQAGVFTLTFEQTRTAPLWVVCDIEAGGQRQARNYYPANFEYAPGCLFTLPETTLAASLMTHAGRTAVVVENTGDKPAVMAMADSLTAPDTFLIADNLVWLDPHEKQELEINITQGLSVSALNSSTMVWL